MVHPHDHLHPFLVLATPAGTELDLSAKQIDRACGVLLAGAAGDALACATGEWTAATSMALSIARAAADGKDLRTRAALHDVAEDWLHLAETSPAGRGPRCRSLGFVPLLCAAPVAIAYLDDEPGLIDAARALCGLAGDGEEAADACVLWSLMIRHAVLTGRLDPLVGLSGLADPDAALRWLTRLDAAAGSVFGPFTDSGVESILRRVLAAVAGHVCGKRPETGCAHLAVVLVQTARDAEQPAATAAIAGGLAGARWGASAVPVQWQRSLHGRSGLGAGDLIALTRRMLGLEPRGVPRQAAPSSPDCPVVGRVTQDCCLLDRRRGGIRGWLRRDEGGGLRDADGEQLVDLCGSLAELGEDRPGVRAEHRHGLQHRRLE